MVSTAIKTLGGFELEEKVSQKTSHVVTNLPLRRTLNLLRGIARGCWIVKQDWVLKSHEQRKWIDEEKYELTEFSPSVQQYRFEKLAFGPAFKPDLFYTCGLIFVCKNTSPSPKDLTELITLCGGRVTSNAQNAEVVVGLYSPDLRRTCLKELWVLDSITDGITKNVEEYTIQRGV